MTTFIHVTFIHVAIRGVLMFFYKCKGHNITFMGDMIKYALIYNLVLCKNIQKSEFVFLPCAVWLL